MSSSPYRIPWWETAAHCLRLVLLAALLAGGL